MNNFVEILSVYRSPIFRKVTIISLIVMLAVLAGQFPSRNLFLLSVLAVGGVLAIVFFSRHLAWGVVALIPISFFGYWNIRTGTNVSLNLSFLFPLLLIGMWVIQNAIVSRSHLIESSAINTPAFSFVVIASLSLITANINWNPWATYRASLQAQIAGWLLYILPIGVMLLTGNVLKVDHLKWVTWLFIGIGGIYIASFFIPEQINVFNGTFDSGGVGGMFWTWLPAMIFGQLLYNKQLPKKMILVLITLLAAIFVAGWFDGRKEWISGWLPGAVGVMVILFFYSWRAGAFLSITLGTVMLLTPGNLVNQIMTSTQEYSISSREAAWSILFELIRSNPIWGLGPSNYYYYTAIYPILGWYVQFNSHNNYIDIIAQIGLVGLAIFAWMVVRLGQLGLKLHNKLTTGFETGYVYGVLGGLAGTLVAGLLGDWFLPFLYNIGIGGFRSSIFAWIFLGGLIALEGLHKAENYSHPGIG